jgi:DNA primase
MDVIALAAAGIGECVAPLGTALTERQIEMLWRLVEVPILCFDGDTAGQRAAMRAVTRALPLLRPGHSLRIVRLPAGLDPDDLIRRDGAKAMESLLDDAKSLIETLWEHERDAVPLATPEAKAGLKARLLVHVETIGDTDIRALYRRELLERFSAFAYPARDSGWRDGGPRGTDWRKGRRPQPAHASPESASRLRRLANGGARDALCAAVIAGLIRWPGQIARHIDTLVRLIPLDSRFGLILDLHDTGEPLESQGLATILARQGMAVPAPAEYAGLRFGFLGVEAPPDQAAAGLAQAIGLLVERPALEAALAEATARYEREFTDEAYAEQQRLLKRKLEFDARLGQMAN